MLKKLACLLALIASPLFAQQTPQAIPLTSGACKLDGTVGCGAGGGGGSGTVTSVAMSGGTTGLSFSGGPITTSGTFTLSGTLAIANGGTNLTTYTLGDILYSSAANTLAKLSGNTTTTKKFLMQVGDGVNSAAPTWTATAADFPTLNQNTTGNAATVTTNANLTGPVTSVGNATTITDAAVTLAKMADLAQDQFIGRTTASTGVPQTATITAAARTVLDDATVSAMVDTIGGASASGTGGLARTTDPALTRPAITGTPAVAGAQGYDSATGATTQYSGLTASVGSFPRVLAVGRPGGTLTNSTTADQDFAAIYTIPANVLVANKVIRVTLGTQLATGVSTATMTPYVKVGSTKVAITSVGNVTDSVTRVAQVQFDIIGTAAPGASVAVECSPSTSGTFFGSSSSVAQPVSGIATNGALDIIWGMAWSATGSTEVVTLLSYTVEELR